MNRWLRLIWQWRFSVSSIEDCPMLETNPGFLFPDRRPLKEMVEDYERKIVLMALELAHWNQRRAASSLGLLPSTLSEKMKRFGLRRTREEGPDHSSSNEAA
jgi:DNA-binding NtrC family response regulator